MYQESEGLILAESSLEPTTAFLFVVIRDFAYGSWERWIEWLRGHGAVRLIV